MRLQKGFSTSIALALLLALVSIVTIAGAYYLIDKARNNAFEDNIVTLNKLQKLDAKWSESILKTRSYTLQDFDSLASYMMSIRKALASLEQRGMSDEKLVGEKTAKQYQIYKHSFATKNESVERYKSQQAILRNSVRYLPEAEKQAKQALTSSDPIHKTANNLLSASTQKINQYLLNVATVDEAKEKLTELKQLEGKLSDDIASKIQDYLVHSRLIIEHKPKVEEALQTAMSVDIAKLSTNLVNQYANSQDAVKQYVKRLQQIMLAGIAMLLALLAWFLFGLRTSATKVLLANTKNKAIQQQLRQSENHIKQVDKNIMQLKQRATSGELSLNTLKRLNTIMPALTDHLSFLQKLKNNNALANHKDKMEEVITDIDELHRNIYELNTLIDPQKNQDKHVDFNFNHVIQSAFDTVSSNIDKEVPFNKKLSAVPSIRASSTDLYQITTKLLNNSVKAWRQGDEDIFIKTWATSHYANLCLSLSGYETIEALYAEEALADLDSLLKRNSAIIKLTPRKEGKSAIIWVSFPYKK